MTWTTGERAGTWGVGVSGGKGSVKQWTLPTCVDTCLSTPRVLPPHSPHSLPLFICSPSSFRACDSHMRHDAMMFICSPSCPAVSLRLSPLRVAP